jgi:hypothetical protein
MWFVPSGGLLGTMYPLIPRLYCVLILDLCARANLDLPTTQTSECLEDQVQQQPGPQACNQDRFWQTGTFGMAVRIYISG